MAGRRSAGAFVSPDELLDALAQLRVAVTQPSLHPARDPQRDMHPTKKVLALEKRADQDWLALPHVQAAFGGIWYALGDFVQAEKAFRNAMCGEQEVGVVPLRHIELLANALTRRAPQLADADDLAGAYRLLDEAIGLLNHLDHMAFSGPRSTHERGGLKGSALKRRAELLLRLKPVDTQKVRDAVTAAGHAYEYSGEKPYQRLNALALKALVCTESERVALVRRVRDCGKVAQDAVRKVPTDSWNSVSVSEALMVEWLLCADAKAAGLERRVLATYRQMLKQTVLQPVQRDSMRTQMALLARLAAALERPALVERLERLLRVLQ
jgi:tetratricopeptide (TPR) repeat protein